MAGGDTKTKSKCDSKINTQTQLINRQTKVEHTNVINISTLYLWAKTQNMFSRQNFAL